MRYGDRDLCPPRLRHGAVAVLLTTYLLALGGCAAVNHLPARLYRLDTGTVVQATLYGFRDGGGRMQAILPDGRTLTGRYALSGHPGATAPPASDAPLWAQVYGYSSGTDAQPAGAGRMSDAAGDVLDVIIYRIDPARTYGTGLARDGGGHWYRVHLGKLPR